MPQNVKIKKNVSKKLIKSKFIKEKIISLSNIIQKCMIFIQKLKITSNLKHRSMQRHGEACRLY